MPVPPIAETPRLPTRRRRELLICLAIVYHPTCDMPTLRVMMRPMDDPAFFIPDILAVEAHTVAYLESVDSRGDVDVMRDQQRLSRRKLNDESLVSRTVQIVVQNANHLALAFDLNVAGPTRKRASDGIIGERRRTLLSGARNEQERKEGNGRCDQNRIARRPRSMS